MKQNNTFSKEWWKAALERAIKTVAEVIIGMVGVGAVIPVYEVNWGYILGVALTSAILSLCISIVNLPESSTDGILQIDTSGQKDIYRFVVDDLDKISEKSRINIKVDAEADLTAVTTVAEDKKVE